MSNAFPMTKLLLAFDNVEKSMNVPQRGMLKEGMSAPSVFGRFPGAEERLQEGILSDTIAFVVDLSPFSSFVASSSAEEIRGLLDYYYNGVVPLIEARGGVIEKYIGDAIIALFGAPFGAVSTNDAHTQSAFQAAAEVVAKVRAMFVDELFAKVAISRGEMFLGFVGPGTHSELTAVGNPLTMLFRLEEMAVQNAVVLPHALYARIEWRYSDAPDPDSAFFTVRTEACELRGVGRVDVTTCVFRGE